MIVQRNSCICGYTHASMYYFTQKSLKTKDTILRITDDKLMFPCKLITKKMVAYGSLLQSPKAPRADMEN